MINVSNRFKDIIKSNEREIKAYVGVEYDVDNSFKNILTIDYEEDQQTQMFGSPDDLKNNNKRLTKYSFLDSMVLDGSTTLFSRKFDNPNTGLISGMYWNGDEFVNAYKDRFYNQPIKLYVETSDGSTKTTNGLTIYFKEGHPTHMKIFRDDQLFFEMDGADGYIGDDDVFFLDQNFSFSYLKIEIYDWSEIDKRPIIAEIDYGFSKLYENKDLIEFTFDEEIDLFNSQTPCNTCKVTVNNENNEFNLLNPNSYSRKLTNKSKIIPYIGVDDEEREIFCPCGQFYFDTWSDNGDLTATIESKSIIDKFSKEDFIVKTSDFFGVVKSYDVWKNWLLNSYDYNIDINIGDRFVKGLSNMYIPNNISLIQYLQSKLLICRSLLKETREAQISINYLDTNVKDEILLTQMLDTPKIEKKEVINEISLVSNQKAITSNEESEQLSFTVKLSKNKEIFKLTTSGAKFVNTQYTQSGGWSIRTIAVSNFMAFVEVEGNIGDTIQINTTIVKNTNEIENNSYNYNFKNNNVSDGVSLEINNYEPSSSGVVEPMADYIYSISKQFEINFEYFGDPSLETGDTVRIETDYGTKDMIITKHTLTYDGGLTGQIEGVAN